MKTNRRNFIGTAMAGAIASSLPGGFPALEKVNENYLKLDEILKKPVLKKELFPDPVIIDTLELLRLNNTFLCRVRSKDGAEGISVANNDQMRSLYPVFINRLQPFFPGKDARNQNTTVLRKQVCVYKY